MGIEYQIQFNYPNTSALEGFVKKLKNVELVSPPGTGFDFRASDSINIGVPDAHFQIMDSGLYFVWYGARGRAFMKTLLSQLGSQFGPVQIEEM